MAVALMKIANLEWLDLSPAKAIRKKEATNGEEKSSGLDCGYSRCGGSRESLRSRRRLAQRNHRRNSQTKASSLGSR
jgi:hypothetical protein